MNSKKLSPHQPDNVPLPEDIVGSGNAERTILEFVAYDDAGELLTYVALQDGLAQKGRVGINDDALQTEF